MSIIKKFSTAIHHLPSSPRRSSAEPSPVGSPVGSPSPSPSSPRRKSIAAVFQDKEYVSSSDDFSDLDHEGGLSKNAQKRQARRQQRESRSRLSLEQREESEERMKQRLQEASKHETEEMRSRYGDLPLMQSTERAGESRVNFGDITPEMAGREIVFRARLHHVRRMGLKLVFFIFKQQINTMQGVLNEIPGEASIVMLHWAEHVQRGSILRIKGILQRPEAPVKSTTLHELEVKVIEMKVVVRRGEPIPFSVQEAEIDVHDENYSEGRRSKISDRTRLSNRIIDLRTSTSQSIFRVQSGVGNLFRSALDEQGFIEIHTPKLQGSATESGASVFKLGYFGRDAFLAQSPQLAKQMAVASDFEKVYELGAVFRAENSNTHRHLTEYTGLDIEMAIEEHYHEALEVLDGTIKNIFAGLYKRYRREIDIIKNQFPHEDLIWLETTPVIPFADAVQFLAKSGWLDEDGNAPNEEEDLSTRDEIRLGELIKEKYHTDYYILDKFPASARPFYTMPSPVDSRYTNSFDIFVRGQEIVSGGQRIHEPEMLEENMRKVGIDPSDMEEYVEGFRWGAPPHAGAGIGLERLVSLILQLGNIRLASMFHRDPKSFPAKPVMEKLRHPEADTTKPSWRKDDGTMLTLDERKLPPLHDLIANYGDATSTSWGDERYKIWRDAHTGAAVAYVPSHSFAILPGNPLCHPSQYLRIISAFLYWLKRETNFKPVWILCSREVEEVLSQRLGWKSLTCVADERVDPQKNPANTDPEVHRKIRHAISEGVEITDLREGKPVPDGVKERANKRVQDWLANRKGTQIHLSEIDLFRDEAHRRYLYAENRDGQICGVAVLAMLAPRHGWQMKYTLDFPGAPSGTIEYITSSAITAAASSGIKSLTFGAGATDRFIPGHHLSGAKVKVLQRAYETLVKKFNLVRKSEFRAKMGATEEPLWIAYPPHGLGAKGIKAIMNFFED